MQKLIDEGLFSKSLFEALDAENARTVEYQARKESLSGAIVSARTTAEALYNPEALTEAIRSGDPELRLKLKSEIAERIPGVIYHEGNGAGRFVDFSPDRFGERKGPVARVQFVNGAERLIVLNGEWAALLWLKVKSSKPLSYDAKPVGSN